MIAISPVTQHELANCERAMFKKLTITPKNDQPETAWVRTHNRVTTAQFMDGLYDRAYKVTRVPVGWIG